MITQTKNIQYFAFAMEHKSSTIVVVCTPDFRNGKLYYYCFPSTVVLSEESIIELVKEIALFISNHSMKKRGSLEITESKCITEDGFQMLMSLPASGFIPTCSFIGENSSDSQHLCSDCCLCW